VHRLRRERITVAAGDKTLREFCCDVVRDGHLPEALILAEVSRPPISPQHRFGKPP
jgi:hypothetical protein